MERKIGEVFELAGRKLEVEKAERGSCTGCGLLNENCFDQREVTGECVDEFRDDETDVIFKDITDMESGEENQ